MQRWLAGGSNNMRALYSFMFAVCLTVVTVQAETVLISRVEPTLVSDTAGGNSFSSRTSADGRYVVFVSSAVNLVARQTDANGNNDVFLYDRVTGTTTLVSRTAASATTTGNSQSFSPVISADGNYVAFSRRATFASSSTSAATSPRISSTTATASSSPSTRSSNPPASSPSYCRRTRPTAMLSPSAGSSPSATSASTTSSSSARGTCGTSPKATLTSITRTGRINPKAIGRSAPPATSSRRRPARSGATSSSAACSSITTAKRPDLSHLQFQTAVRQKIRSCLKKASLLCRAQIVCDNSSPRLLHRSAMSASHLHRDSVFEQDATPPCGRITACWQTYAAHRSERSRLVRGVITLRRWLQ